MAWGDSVLALEPDRAALSDNVSTDLSDLVIWIARTPYSFSESFTPEDNLLARFVYRAELSEALSIDDLVGPRFVYRAGVLSEDLGLADTLTALLRMYLSGVSDAFGPSDLTSALERCLGSVSDNVDLSDTITALLRILALPLDALSTSDEVRALFPFLAGPSDATSIADTVTALMRLLAQTSDQVVLDDVVAALMRLLAVISDSVGSGLVDFVAHVLLEQGAAFPLEYAFSDDVSAGLQDTVLALLRIFASMEDTSSFVDEVAARAVHLAGLSDSLVLSDLVAAQLRMLARPSDQLTMDDLTLALQRALALLSDSENITDNASALNRYLAAASEQLSTLDAVGGLQPQLGQPSDFVSLVDSPAGLFKFRAALGDDVSSALIDAVIANLIEIGFAFPLEYSFADEVQLQDSVTVLQRLFALANDSVSLVDEVAARMALLAGISDNVNLTDALAGLLRHLIHPDDATSLQDNVVAIQRLLTSFSDACQFADEVSTGPMRIVAAMSEAGLLSDEVQAQYNFLASVADFVSLQDLASASLVLLGVQDSVRGPRTYVDMGEGTQCEADRATVTLNNSRTFVQQKVAKPSKLIPEP